MEELPVTSGVGTSTIVLGCKPFLGAGSQPFGHWTCPAVLYIFWKQSTQFCINLGPPFWHLFDPTAVGMFRIDFCPLKLTFSAFISAPITCPLQVAAALVLFSMEGPL